MNSKKLEGKKLFISKNLGVRDELFAWCEENQVLLTAISQISFQETKFVLKDSFDIVFFSSERAAHYFFEGINEIESSWKYACIGQVTANKLEKYKVRCEFVGEEAGNPIKVAGQFKEWVGEQKVCFPRSNVSLKSMQNVLTQDQVIDLEVYQTIPSPSVIEPQDIYVFTSPSNVNAFLQANQIPIKTQLIAWGKSTEKALNEKDLRVDRTLNFSTQKELISILSE